jgi:hypothetical protein
MFNVTDASAADLKSLHHPLQTPVRDFKSISGTGIKYLQVPFVFSKLVSEVAALQDELRKEGTWSSGRLKPLILHA